MVCSLYGNTGEVERVAVRGLGAMQGQCLPGLRGEWECTTQALPAHWTMKALYLAVS